MVITKTLALLEILGEIILMISKKWPKRMTKKKKGPGQAYRQGLSLPQLIRLFPDT